jgi:putative DNA primase/helicase
MEEIKTNSDEFIKFYDALIASAPIGYKPWFFPVIENDKYPDALATFQLADATSSCCGAEWKYVTSAQNSKKSYWGCSKCLAARASWKAPHAQMTKEQCVERLKSGGNIGFAARANDPIIIIDLDDPEVPDIKETLSLQSRSRKGRHRIGLAGDDKIKTNITTGTKGELRSLDEYIVAPGSFVSLSQEAIDKLPDDQKPFAGCYTVDKAIPMATLVYDDLPDCFKMANEELLKNATQTKTNTFNPSTGNHSALFDLKISDIISPTQPRETHPAHGSDTGSNFSTDGNVAICWRHNMAHNAIHLLAVLSGKYECQQVGKRLKGASIPIDNGHIFWAWHEAKTRGLIPIDDPVPMRGMMYVAQKYNLPTLDEKTLSVEVYNKVLNIIESDF